MHPSRLSCRRALLAAAGALAGALIWGATVPSALAAEPVRVGVIAPKAHIDGRAIFQGAELAALEINAHGGINGRKLVLLEYDDHFQATDAVRAFQRAVQQDHVVAMTGVFISEVALALQPWSGRLQTPLIITGAASTKIDTNTHDHYAQLKYTFHHFTNSYYIAKIACDFARDVMVRELGYQRTAIFAEDAAWTKPVISEYKKCLPAAGLKIVDTVDFDPDTTDFRPIYANVMRNKPQVLMTAIAHVGVKPVVQWRQQQVPVMLAGANGQGGSTAFWRATDGATEGVIVGTTGAKGAKVTPEMPKFYEAYTKRFGEEPAYDAYTTYDAIYTLADALRRAGSTQADKLVTALEETHRTGVLGPISFYGPDDKYTHEIRYVPNRTVGVYFQWQNGQQVVLWPKQIADGKVRVPSFVK